MLTQNNIALALRNDTADETYAAVVNALIRRRYSLSAELAVLRQREEKKEEFAVFHAYAEDCKAEARALLKELGATE